MNAMRKKVRDVFLKYHFIEDPKARIARRIFSDAAYGYFNGYITVDFLAAISREILLFQAKKRHLFSLPKPFKQVLAETTQMKGYKQLSRNLESCVRL